jgi:DNA repair exonuclease SbcCD ATPase subunit/DNA repair exonuclease SbcCD nuclease subunit
MKFAHIADTHIRNLKYHKEYKTIFNKIYSDLKKEKVDYIIHCGDICHTKTQISPEYVSMASDFLFNLAEIAPTYVILGNHDGNLRNGNRQDSITPIVDALDHKNLYLLKNSGETVLDNNFTLNVLSVFDEDNWIQPSDKNKVNIALYHGSVTGCRTDIGWVMEHGENDISIFKNFDYAMLGDIHLENQILDKKGRVRYVGSTIQQNFGEASDKGFLLWDIKGKKDFTCKPILYTHPKPFISIRLTPKGKLPKKEVPEGARVRLIVENSISSVALKRVTELAKTKYNPESVSVLNKSNLINSLSSSDDFTKENLRDINVQERLIGEYLTDYELEENKLKQIHFLNQKLNDTAESDEEVYRNVDYQILDLEWDNLFNYGESNKINFSNINGIVGIFGKNFSGKSSIIDSLLFTMYNSISKNSRKNLNIVNNDKQYGCGKVRIRRGNYIYTIDRRADKYLKKLKKVETVEAKTIVDFSREGIETGEHESLNGTTRADTDRNIIKYFGTLDDFLITSMSSQLGSLMFINEGSTKRKEILAKFLDLNLFDRKFKLAKKDSEDLKAVIKQNDDVDFNTEIRELELKLISNESATIRAKSFCSNIKKEIEEIDKEVVDLTVKIKSKPVDFIDIDQIKKELRLSKQNLKSANNSISDIKQEINTLTDRHIKIKTFVDNWDGQKIKQNKLEAEKIKSELNNMIRIIGRDEDILDRCERDKQLLLEVPCGDAFPTCKFISGAHKSKEQINIVELAIKNNKKAKENLRSDLDTLNPSKIEQDLKKFNDVLMGKKDLEGKINSNKLKLENFQNKKQNLEEKIQRLVLKEEKYASNRTVIENIKELKLEKEDKETLSRRKKCDLEDCEGKLLELYKSHGYYEQRVETLKANKEKLENQKEAYETYDLFMRCMHPNGIAYDIIKKSLPAINTEISNVLSNVVDFNVFFETDDNRLDIYIKHPNKDPSPLDMASGAEKTLAAMAIRLAFISVSSLPRSQLFILDEPGTALDEERMEGFTRILDVIKSIFKTVILISHLDNLKDSADMVLPIAKKDGYASINY